MIETQKSVYYLSIIVKPVKGEVFNSYRRPLIIDLSSRAIDYVSDFVSYDEF